MPANAAVVGYCQAEPELRGITAPLTHAGKFMSELLLRLYKDHTRLRRLMDVLEDEAARIPSDGSARVIVRDVLDYMTSYPDRFHHPVENELFEVLATVNVRLGVCVARLQGEHEWIVAEGRKLLLLAAGTPPPAQLVSRLKRYADHQRQHMRVEEAEVFQPAARELDPVRWRRLAQGTEGGPDPLFGLVVQERYRELYAYIMRRHSRDSVRKR